MADLKRLGKDKKVGVVIMTALLPTKGHQYLIEFAANFVDHLTVLVFSRSHEPINGDIRVNAFYQELENKYFNCSINIENILDDNAPQEPNPNIPYDENFWNYWKEKIENQLYYKPDYVFASEYYGHNLATVLNAEFIPVDINREIVPTKGTTVRENLMENFYQIISSIQKLLRRKVVFFGAESTGKTTWAKKVSERMNGAFLHEWARPYLETVGSRLDDVKLENIVKGQLALEKSMENLITNKPFIMADTDLFSTLGYFRIYGKNTTDLCNILEGHNPRYRRGDLYLIMDTDIPLEEDELRYGGKKRESNTLFWINLCKEFNLPYQIIRGNARSEDWISSFIYHYFYKSPGMIKDLIEFQR